MLTPDINSRILELQLTDWQRQSPVRPRLSQAARKPRGRRGLLQQLRAGFASPR
ncbi:MAG: hypothetical protein KDH92_09775 [Chloroflexi bacterium]|nr:hypothetical protein [Chloroflexota bacterium]